MTEEQWIEAVNIAQARAEAAEAQRDDLLVAAERLVMSNADARPRAVGILSGVVRDVREAMNTAAKAAFDREKYKRDLEHLASRTQKSIGSKVS